MLLQRTDEKQPTGAMPKSLPSNPAATARESWNSFFARFQPGYSQHSRLSLVDIRAMKLDAHDEVLSVTLLLA